MYRGGFGHDDLGQVVEVSGQAMITMIANLDGSLRSREAQDLRNMLSSSNVVSANSSD